MDTYIARQPIFDKSMKIFAYELLFRSNAQTGVYTGANADQASSRVVMDSFHTMGLDAITGGKPAFVNFTPTLLLEKVATLFPKNMLVIELLETIEPTPEIVKVCIDLYQSGYMLAMDDFIYRPELEPLIKLSKIIKFDFLACTAREIAMMLKQMNTKGKLLLAEKVESAEVFDQAVRMGFKLFQGYFFSKPVTVASKDIEPLKFNYVSLLKEANNGFEMNFDKLGQIIQNDVALTYKLLRMVNSAYFGMLSQVTDIKFALSVLGVKEIRKWISLMAMMGLNSNKPDELIRLSMIRGHFIEKSGALCRGPLSRMPYSAENMFLTGLFSLIDVLLNQPMESALNGIVLAPEVYDALVKQSGRLYSLLSLVICLERCDWDEADRLAASLDLNSRQVSDVYLDAVKWCNEIPF